MSDDIAPILREWEYRDGPLQVRLVDGQDGRPKIQLRIDLGLMQMELTGRPDGERPFGCESLLDYYRAQAEAYRDRYGWYEGFELDSDQCEEIRRESLQYYHRRVARLQLQDYPGALTDADHNLQILDLLKAFAARREDWLVSEQYRAFILSHRVQAAALYQLQRGNPHQALVELERGLRDLREVFLDQDQLESFQESTEASLLRDLKRKIETQYSVDRRRRLQMLLEDAVRREDIEAVRELRAQLRAIDTEN